MIEILLVVVIIGILMALLLPAIGSAQRRVRDAAVQSEENAIAQGLQTFRVSFGDYPPSRIILCEDANYAPVLFGSTSLASTLSPSAVDQPDSSIGLRSLAFLRRFWPRLNLSTSAPLPGGQYYDFNGNGKLDGPVLLQGDECLVWFLGGVPTSSPLPTGSLAYGVTGWSANPLAPFAAAGNRRPPLYDFRAERLADLDGDGYPSYLDTFGQGRPLVYFSAYGNGGYDPNDVNFDASSPLVESDDAGTSPIMSRFSVAFPTPAGATALSPAPNPYTLTPSVNPRPVWFQAQTFQLLSAGGDGEYGVGGAYSPEASDKLPFDPAIVVGTAAARVKERDNITNFRTGRLD